MIETNSKFNDSNNENNTDYQSSEITQIRFRHQKSNIPLIPTAAAQPAHFVLSTGDFPSDNRDEKLSTTSTTRHNKTQIAFLCFTTLAYLIHSLQMYLPKFQWILEDLWLRSNYSSLNSIYTIDVRPSLIVEQFLFRVANIGQVLWLIYVSTWIFRRTHLGYLYRNPDLFNSWLCFLLISALSFQTLKQFPLPAEIVCFCYFFGGFLLIVVGRQISVKIERYADKYQSLGLSIDFFLLRYVVLNGLFLYTTSVVYSTVSLFVEYYGGYVDSHLDPPIPFASTNLCGTIGLSVGIVLLLIYFCFDQFVYSKEFQTIWSPYIFVFVAFLCPPLRKLGPIQQDIPFNDRHVYLLWTIFSLTTTMIVIRLIRNIYNRYRTMKNRLEMNLPRLQTQS